MEQQEDQRLANRGHIRLIDWHAKHKQLRMATGDKTPRFTLKEKARHYDDAWCDAASMVMD